MPNYEVVQAAVVEIEAEMKRIGMWQEKPLAPEQLQFKQAFGGDTMAFHQWLQFVFLPRVREIIAAKGKFPNSSQVADQAFREWKMWGSEQNADALLEMLRRFDGLFS